MELRPILAALLLSACATTGTDADIQSYGRSGLAGQTLDPGECGLFVWRADTAKTFALFSSAAKGVLHVGEETAFTPNADATAPQQTITVDEREYTLDLRRPEPVEGGTKYSEGALKTVSDAGWDVLIPVLGLSLCQPDTTS